MDPASVPATVAEPTLERRLGLFSATTLVVGSMIGSGIFLAPSIMAAYVATPGIFLLLWLVGGVLTLLGALSYGELCAMAPRAGGQYVFLREAFGPLTAFLYGWTFFLVIQTGTNAAVGLAFAKFLRILGVPIDERLIATVVILFLTGVNCRGVKEGAFVQNLFTVLKIGAIVLLVGAGVALGRGSLANFHPLVGSELGIDGLKLGFMAAVGVAMSKALFAYDAWNTVTFAAEEVREPAKNLPRALLLGTVVTTIAYLAACAAYLYVLPMHELARVPENRVAAEVARVMMGQPGMAAVSLLILISTFGCLNGLILGGGRVIYAMARDGLFFRGCGRVHPRFHTPAWALVLQGLWSVVLAFSGSYSALLTYSIFASLAFNMLTVVGTFVLRRTQPDAVRPYKTWGHPVTPALYIVGTLFFLFYILIGDPRNSLYGVGLVAIGVPAYLVFRRRAQRAAA